MSIEEVGDLHKLVAIDFDATKQERTSNIGAGPGEESARRESWLVILWVESAEDTPEYIYGEIAQAQSDVLQCRPGVQQLGFHGWRMADEVPASRSPDPKQQAVVGPRMTDGQ